MIDDATLLEAIQTIYQLAWAQVLDDRGLGMTLAGQNLEDICPRGPSKPLIAIARSWVDKIERQCGSITDQFVTHNFPEDDHGSALYYLFMSCLGHGVGIEDYCYDHDLHCPWPYMTRFGRGLPMIEDCDVAELAETEYEKTSLSKNKENCND